MPDVSRYAVFGHPIAHSLSPRMLNAAFRRENVHAVFLPLHAKSLDDLLECVRDIPIHGLSVTMPYKEEMVEHLSGFSENLVEQHEEAALIATIGLSLLGIAALVGLFYRGVRRWYPKAVLLGALLVSGLMAWTANLGGQIRHTEIRPGTQIPAAETQALHD